MTPRKLLFAGAAVLVIFATWLLWPSEEQEPTDSPRTFLTPTLPASATAPTPAPSPSSKLAATPSPEPVGNLAVDLNAANGTIAHDLQILNDLLNSWRLDFPGVGNPVGDNADITKNLLGDNRLRLAYLPRNHPAINAQGELADRWGTPFRFHALSGTRMEIRSAGPDKKFGTADDAVLTPP